MVAYAHKPHLLLVEDDDRVARLLARQVGEQCSVALAPSADAARALLDGADEFVGAIIDIRLPDGSGLALVSELRARGVRGPVLVITGYYEDHHALAAQLYGAEFAPKPIPEIDLGAFASRVCAFAELPESRLSRMLEQFAERHHLTRREAEIVALAVADFTRAEMVAQMDVSANTLKSQVRSLLRKSEARSLVELARQLRRAARGA